MAYIFEYLRQEFGDTIRDGVFYDLGSGTGKAVVAMSLIHPFKKCVGIEYLETLYDLSQEVKQIYDSTINEKFSTYKQLFTMSQPNKIEFIKGDFLKEKWEDTSVILANSTCFNLDLISAIGNKANKECKSGTIIVTFTKRLNSLDHEWEFKDGFKRIMTWGIATIYVHKKK